MAFPDQARVGEQACLAEAIARWRRCLDASLLGYLPSPSRSVGVVQCRLNCASKVPCLEHFPLPEKDRERFSEKERKKQGRAWALMMRSRTGRHGCGWISPLPVGSFPLVNAGSNSQIVALAPHPAGARKQGFGGLHAAKFSSQSSFGCKETLMEWSLALLAPSEKQTTKLSHRPSLMSLRVRRLLSPPCPLPRDPQPRNHGITAAGIKLLPPSSSFVKLIS